MHPDETARTAANAWLVGPLADSALFVGTPLLILPAAFVFLKIASAELFVLVVAAFGQLGHTLPSLLRAYGDRDLFERFRLRFTVAPTALIAACVAGVVWHLHALILVGVVWAVWHALMQTYGFVRIYALKEDAAWADRFRRLDLWLCILGFGGALVLNDQPLVLLLRRWYQCGGGLIDAHWIELTRFVWWTALGGLAVLYLKRLRAQQRETGHLPGRKLAVLASSIGFYWYAYAGAPNILVGAALFEVFHDVQYLALVWLFQQRQVQRGAACAHWAAKLFRRSPALIGCYVGIVFAFGSLKFLEHALPATGARETLIGVLAAIGMIHYYFDGFIWKLAEPQTRRPLELTGGGFRFTGIPAWRHGVKWAVGAAFVLPLLWAELSSPPSETQMWVRLSTSVPHVAGVQRQAADSLLKDGDRSAAVAPLQRAVQLDPHDTRSRLRLAALELDRGRPMQALNLSRHVVRNDAANADAVALQAAALAALGRTADARRSLEEFLAEHDAPRVRQTLESLPPENSRR